MTQPNPKYRGSGFTSSADTAENSNTKIHATVLLVDDDQVLVDGLVELFRQSGGPYDITALKALDGSAALSLMERTAPDIIVTDVGMPHMDGYGLLEAVRARPEWVHIPFVFLTGHIDDQAVRRGRTSGAELYLTKPVKPDELVAVVQAQLDLARGRLQRRMQSAEAVRREILRTLQHEFRTPLGYVTAYYEILADALLSGDSPERMSEYLNGIQMGATQLRKLVQELVIVIDLFSGDAEHAFRESAELITDLDAILEQAVEAFADRAEQHNIALSARVPHTLPPVYGDRRSLVDVFARLLDNAVKFTAIKRTNRRRRGKILVSAERLGNTIRCSIQDDGIGIPDTALDNMFDLFYQHDRPILEQQGTGAGLTIARGKIALHNGNIEVHSTPGSGSTFTVVLPVYSSDQPPVMAQADELPRRRTVTVLSVDDDTLILQGITELFFVLGSQSPFEYRVLTANDGFTALRLLKQHAVDIILCDVKMPGMDGYAFLERVHANPDWITIPVIFLTAQRSEAEISRGLRMGVDEYLAKPYNPVELFDVVEARLKRQFAVDDVVRAGFQTLRESILASLSTGLIEPLDTVADHTQALLNNVGAAQTPADLKQSLLAIETGSSQLASMIADFTLLVELRAEAVTETDSIRTLPALSLPDLVELSAEAAVASAENKQRGLDLSVTTSGPFTVSGNLKLLGDLFRRLAQLQIDGSTADAVQPITLARAGQHIAVRYTCEHVGDLRLGGAQVVAQIRTLIENRDRSAVDDPTLSSQLLIARELVALHGGSLQAESGPNDAVVLTVLLPASDSAETAP